MRLAVIAGLLTLRAVVVPSAARGQAVPEAQLLRANLDDWQEGPTDGRICLDARILPPTTARSPSRTDVWPSATLVVLLRDTLVAVARGTLPAPMPYRSCTPSRYLPRLVFSRPLRTQGGFMITTLAVSDSSTYRARTLIGRRHGRWMVVDHPDMRFKALRAPS